MKEMLSAMVVMAWPAVAKAALQPRWLMVDRMLPLTGITRVVTAWCETRHPFQIALPA
jgi:hypothetical protein